MDFDYKNVLIMGYGKSGQAVEKIIKKLGVVSYQIYDKGKRINGGKYTAKLSKNFIRQFDLLVVSPGISVYNKYIAYAERIGIKVIGELEFGYWFTDSPVIAVTGTNGKTTTTNLINQIIGNKFTSGAFGNIGVPLSEAHDEELDYLVCEVSSFQLETTGMFTPYISVLLNIAEDHLDRHKNMDNYIKCKLGLLKNCTEKSIIVLNADDKIIMDKTANIKANKYYISMYEKVRGVYINNGKIYSCLGNKPEKIIELKDIEHLYGVLQDVLASILVAVILKVDKESIIETVKRFELSPHRLEVVAKHNNITYIDDSKSTNIHSTINGLSAIKDNAILLLGGEDKKLNFAPIFEKFNEKLDMVIAFGSARKKILATAYKCGFEKIRVVKTFVDAVNEACNSAVDGNIVLLSPACSSFDEFENYAERGKMFSKVVRKIIDAKS